MNSESLYSYRLRLGRQLEESPALRVIGVPDSGVAVAFPKRLAFPTLRG